MQINLQDKLKLHNKYTLELIDSTTGEIKQKAYAENVVLNTLWTSIFPAARGDIRPYYGVALGTGSGTPAVTDTGLFTQAFVYDNYSQFTLVSRSEAYPTCAYTYRISIPASASYVGSLTEIGLRANYRETTSGTITALWTHALLKDAEGNPITVVKTDLDILTITFTIYVTFGSTDSNFHWMLPGPSNTICKFFRDNAEKDGPLYGSLVHCDKCLLFDDGCIHFADWPSGASVGNGAYNKNTKTISVASARLVTGAGNVGYYNGLCYYRSGSDYFTYLGGIVYPNASIFPNQTITGMSLGVGDGTTTNFALPIEFIVPNTDVVKVNGVAKTRGVDYTINNVNETLRYNENMSISAFMIPLSGHTVPSNYTRLSNNPIETDFGSSAWLPFSQYEATPALAGFVKNSTPTIFKVSSSCPSKKLTDIIFKHVGIKSNYTCFYEDRTPLNVTRTTSNESSIANAATAIIRSITADPSQYSSCSTPGTLIARIHDTRYQSSAQIASVTRWLHTTTDTIYYAIVTIPATGNKYFMWFAQGSVSPFSNVYQSSGNYWRPNERTTVTVDGVQWTYSYCNSRLTDTVENGAFSIESSPCFCTRYDNSSSSTFLNGCKLILSGGQSDQGPWTQVLQVDLSNLTNLGSSTYGIYDASTTIQEASYDYYKLALDVSGSQGLDFTDPNVKAFVPFYNNLATSAESTYMGAMVLGSTGGGVTFTTPPAVDDVITIDGAIDRPFKNSNFVIDASMTLQF